MAGKKGTTPQSKKKASGVKKTKVATATKNKAVAKLLQLASGAPPLSFAKRKSHAKLFEIAVLADLISNFRAAGGNVHFNNAPGGVLTLAGAPARACKQTFSWATLSIGASVDHEAWISVQFSTLSWERSGGSAPVPSPARHELDVALFEELPSNYCDYPSFRSLHAGFSCKHFSPSKESVREALGIRRETAFLTGSDWSLVSWRAPLMVPASPASPIYLCSSSPSVIKYAQPLDTMGVYMMTVPFK